MQYVCPGCKNLIEEGVNPCPCCGQVFCWPASSKTPTVGAIIFREPEKEPVLFSRENVIRMTIAAVICAIAILVAIYFSPVGEVLMRGGGIYDDFGGIEPREKIVTAADADQTEEPEPVTDIDSSTY